MNWAGDKQGSWSNVRNWCKQIQEAAQASELEIELLTALVWWESGGNPLILSPSGAVGLTQVMPKDGISASFICENGPCFANRPTITELQNPEFNLNFGAGMLSGLIAEYGLREGLRRYGGNYSYAEYADRIVALYQNLLDN